MNEVSKLSGVSIRTLHHYDALGLLKPTKTSDAGYRLYDDEALARLQVILLFRELEFPLKEIKRIIDHPDFDKKAAIEQQITLLEMQQKRLGEIISLARLIKNKGENCIMSFSAFDKTKIEEYEKQARERWSNTDAYKQYEQEHASSSDKEKNDKAMLLMAYFERLGALKDLSPDDEGVLRVVEELRTFICQNYYNCTKPIFLSLGEMYAAGGEFTENIDAAGGCGTGTFAKRAIECYCEAVSE